MSKCLPWFCPWSGRVSKNCFFASGMKRMIIWRHRAARARVFTLIVFRLTNWRAPAPRINWHVRLLKLFRRVIRCISSSGAHWGKWFKTAQYSAIIWKSVRHALNKQRWKSVRRFYPTTTNFSSPTIRNSTFEFVDSVDKEGGSGVVDELSDSLL